MRSLMIAAVVAVTFASGANAAQVDWFNKTHTPLAANTHIGSASTGGGGGKASAAGGGGKVIHCAPGAKGKACHKP